MSQEPSKITGTCLCGSISIALPSTPPVKSMTCYCTDCKKNAGGPYQTNAMFPTESVNVTDARSTLKCYTIKEGTFTGFPKEKWFCGECGCTLFTKPGHYKGEMTVVKTGVLDGKGPDHFKPEVELYASSRPSFCKPVEGCQQVQTMPGK